MDVPKISVIVPVYNVEQYLSRCIDSILAQNFADFELLLIDDGSPDNSGKICDEYAEKDSRIRVFHKENGGVSSARNLGLDNAQGEWILFMDGDDVFLTDVFSQFINATKRFQEKIVITDFEIVNYDGSSYRWGSINKELQITNPLKMLWRKKIYARPGNTLIHSDVFKLIKGYDTSISYNEDYEFALRLFSLFSIVYIPVIAMRYFKVANGASDMLHPYEKDFASKIHLYSRCGIYMKMLLYSVWLFDKKKREKGNSVPNEIYKIGKTFNTSLLLRFYWEKIYRRIRKIRF